MNPYGPWGPPHSSSQLPPTPPEYQPGWNGEMMSDQIYYKYPQDQSRGQSGREFIDRFTNTVGPPTYTRTTTAHGPQMFSAYDTRRFLQPTEMAGQIAGQYYGSKLNHPVMLPQPNRPYVSAQNRAINQKGTTTKRKDDAPKGGVASVLDYDLDVMTNFVAEMTQKLVTPNAPLPSVHYKQYVQSMLTSTRLPSSTILLALFYLASRMKQQLQKMTKTDAYPSVYKTLTISLLLGSKFLDDNTFQNRSWADVSNIAVQELNKMELEWLKGFEWTLHGPMLNEENGFWQWRRTWLAYASAMGSTGSEIQKLTPIDTSSGRLNQRVQPPPQLGSVSPEGPIPQQYQRASHQDRMWAQAMISDYSPPSAQTTSGPVTPDYYLQPNWSHAPPPYSNGAYSNCATPMCSNFRSQPPSYPHTPLRLQPPTQTMWKGQHGPSCPCGGCQKPAQPFIAHQAAYGIHAMA